MKKEASQEWICEKIVEEASDAIMFSDRQGIIRLWNHGAESMFGYAAAEALGHSLDLIIPENLRDRHWDGYYRVMESGESRYCTELLSAPALRRDGTLISTEFSMVLVKGDDDAVLGVAAVIRDVSARWLREKELKKRLSELENELPRRKRTGYL